MSRETSTQAENLRPDAQNLPRYEHRSLDASPAGEEPLEVFVSDACKLLVDDPEFSTLPLRTRELVLRKIDPAFASLNRYERYLLLFQIALKHGAEQGGVTVDGIPLELALPDRIRETLHAMRAKLPDLEFYLDKLKAKVHLTPPAAYAEGSG